MRYKDLEGEKYNHLTIIDFSHMDCYSYWNVRCDCGKEFAVRLATVVNGDRKSCGCFTGHGRLPEKERLVNRGIMIMEALSTLKNEKQVTV